jgi:hypothetical protein
VCLPQGLTHAVTSYRGGEQVGNHCTARPSNNAFVQQPPLSEVLPPKPSTLPDRLTFFEMNLPLSWGSSARRLTTSANDSLLARLSLASMLITATDTRAAFRGTLNQGVYLGLGLRG